MAPALLSSPLRQRKSPKPICNGITKPYATSSPGKRKSPIPVSNGISRPQVKRKTAMGAKLSPKFKQHLLAYLLHVREVATPEPMALVTAQDHEADKLKEKYRVAFDAFEQMRSEPDLASFENEAYLAALLDMLEDARDDMELFDLEDPAEVRVADCWQYWYMLECQEFLQGSAVTVKQRQLKWTVGKIVRKLERARVAAAKHDRSARW